MVQRLSDELEKMRNKSSPTSWYGQSTKDVASASMSALFELVLASRLALRLDGGVDWEEVREEEAHGTGASSSGGRTAADEYGLACVFVCLFLSLSFLHGFGGGRGSTFSFLPFSCVLLPSILLSISLGLGLGRV